VRGCRIECGQLVRRRVEAHADAVWCHLKNLSRSCTCGSFLSIVLPRPGEY
jgi:hypothetical protein